MVQLPMLLFYQQIKAIPGIIDQGMTGFKILTADSKGNLYGGISGAGELFIYQPIMGTVGNMTALVLLVM